MNLCFWSVLVTKTQAMLPQLFLVLTGKGHVHMSKEEEFLGHW